MKNMTKLIAAASLFALPLTPLAAQERPVKLSGDVKAVEVVTNDAGEETIKLVEPKTIIPGTRLVFGTDYSNAGDEEVTNFNVTNPLPTQVRLAPDADPALTVSVDGGKSWGTLDQLSVTDENGETRAASHADVTHVRWTLASIAPGESGRLEYPGIIR